MFPLYDTLKRKPRSEVVIDHEKTCQILNSLPETAQEHVYVLIRSFELEHAENSQILPFGGKQFKKGLKFDFNEFPDELKHILYEFTQLL